MRKAPDAFRTISEVAELLQTPAHVLRFWESKFTQVRPVKRAGGRRYYRPADLKLLSGIRTLLHDRGMTIRGVQKMLQEQGVRHVADQASERVLAVLDVDVIDGADAGSEEMQEGHPPADAAAGQHARFDPQEADAPVPEARAPVADPPSERAAIPPPAADVEHPEPAPPDALPDALSDALSDAPARSLGPAPRADAPIDVAPDAQPDAVQADAAAEPPHAEHAAANDATEPAAAALRLAVRLRMLEAAWLDDPARRRLSGAARRIDALLDRMSTASGADRW